MRYLSNKLSPLRANVNRLQWSQFIKGRQIKKFRFIFEVKDGPCFAVRKTVGLNTHLLYEEHTYYMRSK